MKCYISAIAVAFVISFALAMSNSFLGGAMRAAPGFLAMLIGLAVTPCMVRYFRL